MAVAAAGAREKAAASSVIPGRVPMADFFETGGASEEDREKVLVEAARSGLYTLHSVDP
jgi:hypothetical protein